MLYISQTVLHEIETMIAAHPPERGGMLFGPPKQEIISRFLFDEWAETTSVTYRPSDTITRRIQEIEVQEGLEFKGVIHSHPGGFDRPSTQDQHELNVGLQLNPHLPFYLAPIVTNIAEDAKSHEILIEGGKVSFFCAYRKKGGGIYLKPIPTEIIVPTTMEVPNYMERDLERICQEFGGMDQPEVFRTTMAGVGVWAGKVLLDGNLELIFLFNELYPALPPLLLVKQDGKDTEQIQITWELELPAEERLLVALRKVFTPPGPYRKVYGPSNGESFTENGELAQLAGWSAHYSGQDIQAKGETIINGLFARSGSLLSKNIRQKRALVVGAGSVGSYLAEQLVRSGVGKICLVDPDHVEAANISRTVYDFTDVQKPKVEALARHLLSINPLLEISLSSANLLDFAPSELYSLIRRADLVIAATDDPKAQRTLNHFAYACGVPSIFIGLYEGAQGGEVILSVSEKTPCYLCATLSRHAIEEETKTVHSTTDYGTGRLRGETALAADIHHVSSAAVKMALTLLLPRDSEASLTRFLDDAVAGGLTYLTLSMVPNYWFYPEIFNEVAGQYAYQGVWLSPTRRANCPVCGESEHREDPLRTSLRGPSAENLRAAGRRNAQPEA
ncbi:MAG: ThiF family adenylyltransferase [Chloroflexota bacterium]|nr:ThiF family adenylyltransferase [Chloroflexota bacterium]